MKVISQQGISKGIRDWFDVFRVQIHEVGVVAFLDENILAIRAAIVDVIVGIVEERGRTGHIRKTLKVSMVDSRLVYPDSLSRRGGE